jgi:hypothetical protein
MNLQHRAMYTCWTLLLLMGGSLWGQRTWVPDDYHGISETDKRVLFIDEFVDNHHQWDLGSLYLDEEIINGEFRCVSHSSHNYTKHQTIPLRKVGHYEIELNIRFVKGLSSVSQLGLTFGRDAKGNEYNLVFNPKLQYRLYRYERNRAFDLIGWRSDGALRLKHGYNRLMIRQVDDRWYIFINRSLVEELPAHPLFGDQIGFTLGGNMEVEVDFIRVSEIMAQDTEGPDIQLMEPMMASESEELVLHDARQIIRGRVDDPSGVQSVAINGHPITVSEEGIFTASILLSEGRTPIEIVATDRYQHSSIRRLIMNYTEVSALPSMTHSPRPSPSAASYMNQYQEGGIEGRGNNYLLLIGINDYRNWNPLHNAVKDCRDIAETLTTYYQFEPDKVITLFNENATRENILETLEGLQEMITSEENLLIYYAGHGYYDDFSRLGYWVPVDARLNKIPDFIRNSTIHDYLRTIDTKHTLLIADACYAGSLFATSRGDLDINAKSRWAFTSGDIEKVWDGQPGQNSPFARYLIGYLKNNHKPELLASDLIDAVKTTVQRNTAQTPQGSALRQAGDNGGVFVFYRK